VPNRLRDYRTEDFEEMWRIDQECFAEGIAYSRAQLGHFLKRRGAFALLAEDAQGIAGFVVAEARRGGAGHIITLDVRARARRRGLGSGLLQAAEERLCAAGSEAVDNRSALRFYKRHGYAVLKVLPHYYQGELDGLLLGKRLGE
jgi:ribosomal-protein-alanine N-acetyltransferase